jgi:hypothetical protein
MTDEVKAPEVPKAPEFNVEELHREIEAANKKIVSDEVAQLIAKEKEAARKEAEKEFLVNQKLKDKEAELEALKKAQLEKERANAEQLEALKRKVDEMAASKQPTVVANPFSAPTPTVSPSQPLPSVLNLPEAQLSEVERESFNALFTRKRVK